MIDKGRRIFFKKCVMAGAVLAASGAAVSPREAGAFGQTSIQGVCLRVPNFEVGGEFVEQMRQSAPGSWRVHTLAGTVSDVYLETRALYEEAKGTVNTFVGVSDPANFALMQAAIGDCGGSFHYITYDDASRVSFSVRM